MHDSGCKAHEASDSAVSAKSLTANCLLLRMGLHKGASRQMQQLSLTQAAGLSSSMPNSYAQLTAKEQAVMMMITATLVMQGSAAH